jgi:Tol biopolymer transport system component
MDHTLQPGDGISHYRIVGLLGSGGMAEVYLAQDLTLERHVALKILPPQMVRNEERLRRFVIEAKSASSLNHPSIVTIHEIGSGSIEREGTSGAPIHFIAMERIDGHTLAELIHVDKEDLRRLLGYLAQAADGIAKAHAAGIVHRDLKPGNIMVSRDGFAKVLDFGLAKLTESRMADESASAAPTRTGEHTGAGTVMGTVGYMSPEQVQGKPVDHRSDIFSFGCILYEAVTRRRAFEGDSAVDTMHKILHTAPVETHELNPTAPTDLRRLVRRCLAKSPDQRLQSMKDLSIELREIADGYDALSKSASSGSGASAVGAVPARAGRRFGLAQGIAALAVIAALAAGAYFVLGRKTAEGGRAEGQASDMKMSVLMSRADIDTFVLSGDGRYLAYVTTEADKSSLNVRQVKTGADVRIVPPQEFGIRGISFSPDGDYVYYLNRDPVMRMYSALFQVPSLGGTPRKIFFDIDDAAGWSPDGSRACFRRGRLQDKTDTLVVGDLSNGSDRELARITLPMQFVTTPAWSPDGKRVAVGVLTTEGGGRVSVRVIDVGSGRYETITAKPFSFRFMDSVAWLPDGNALIVTALVAGSNAAQVFRIASPGGETRRLTYDLSGYTGLSLAASGRSIAAMRRTDVSNVWIAPADGAMEAHPVTFATGASGSSRQPVPIPGGLIFTVDESDGPFLWRAAEDGSDRRQLLAHGRFNFGARYTERTGVVFTQVSEKELVLHIWRADPDGSGLRQLTDGKGENFMHLSRDGRIILFAKMDAECCKVWSLDPVAGGEPKLLASNTSGDRVTVSPDGRLVQYQEFETVDGRLRPRLVFIPVEGGEPVAKLSLPSTIGYFGWSPDSKSITYVDRARGWNLMRQPLAGGEPVQLTRFTDGVNEELTWSLDGARLAVARRIGPKCQLWSVTPGKGEPKLLAEFRSGAIRDVTSTLDSKNFLFTYVMSSKDVVLISDFQ